VKLLDFYPPANSWCGSSGLAASGRHQQVFEEESKTYLKVYSQVHVEEADICMFT
jgi:hypothetical protein